MTGPDCAPSAFAARFHDWTTRKLREAGAKEAFPLPDIVLATPAEHPERPEEIGMRVRGDYDGTRVRVNRAFGRKEETVAHELLHHYRRRIFPKESSPGYSRLERECSKWKTEQYEIVVVSPEVAEFFALLTHLVLPQYEAATGEAVAQGSVERERHRWHSLEKRARFFSGGVEAAVERLMRTYEAAREAILAGETPPAAFSKQLGTFLDEVAMPAYLCGVLGWPDKVLYSLSGTVLKFEKSIDRARANPDIGEMSHRLEAAAAWKRTFLGHCWRAGVQAFRDEDGLRPYSVALAAVLRHEEELGMEWASSFLTSGGNIQARYVDTTLASLEALKP